MEARRIIGDYELLEKLGSGLQGKVYRARHLGTGGIFAVKLIDSAAVSRSPKTFNNLQREITAMQRVSGHAHVVGLVHFDMAASKPRKRRAGQFQPVIMLVLELAVGGEIFDYLMLSKLHEDVARTYFNQLLEALHFCHNNGVAHRDLKPENLLLDGNYNLRVADWGLSAVMDDIDAAMLRTQCGTRAYMAPELLRREPYKGQPADMWSAGVVLFIMLSGFPPFETASAGDWWYDRIAANQHALFWQAHERSTPFSASAKDLLNAIFVSRPAGRMTIEDAMKHPWTQGPTMSPEALRAEMHSRRLEILRSKGIAYHEEDALAAGGYSVTTPDITMSGMADITMSGVPSIAGADLFVSTATRGEVLPARRPAFGPRGIKVDTTAPSADTPLDAVFPSSIAISDAISVEQMPEDAALPSGPKFTWFFCKAMPVQALLSGLAGCTEKVIGGTAHLKADSGAKIRASKAGLAGVIRYDIRVYTISDSQHAARTDIPADAAFYVELQRQSGDALAFGPVFAAYTKALARFIAVPAPLDCEVKSAPAASPVQQRSSTIDDDPVIV